MEMAPQFSPGMLVAPRASYGFWAGSGNYFPHALCRETQVSLPGAWTPAVRCVIAGTKEQRRNPGDWPWWTIAPGGQALSAW